jgi:hypothetical protein
VLAGAPRVQNTLPEGSTWDGKSDLPMDEASFKQIVSEIEPGAPAPAPAAGAPAPAAGAPAGAAPASTVPGKTPPPPPKDGGGS